MASNNQTKTRKQRESNPPKLIAYHVADRGRGRKFWTRIGAVWDHKNGDGLTVFVNVLPIEFDGRIVLLPPRDDDQADERQDGEAGQAEDAAEVEGDEDGEMPF